MNRRRFLILAGGVVVAGAAAGVGVAAGRSRSFQNQIDEEIAELLAAARPPAIGTVTEADVANLPAPVQRWLRASGVVGTTVPSVVRIAQRGEFRLGSDGGWMPMRATQYYTTNPPGFLWDASMKMFSVLPVTGRDRYVDGAGDIEMRIASIIPVARKSGGNLNDGALLRYLNETMWFPAALVLPNVTWDAVDDASARATLTNAGQSVSAVFVFDDQDRLATMTADRWNDTDQAIRPWSTPISDWGTFAGIDLATAGAGIWNIGPDAYEYIRLRITNVEYDPSGVGP
ncbi:MAG: DUF6544 family protein [Thermomicrobiales bacterium]